MVAFLKFNISEILLIMSLNCLAEQLFINTDSVYYVCALDVRINRVTMYPLS